MFSKLNTKNNCDRREKGKCLIHRYTVYMRVHWYVAASFAVVLVMFKYELRATTLSFFCCNGNIAARPISILFYSFPFFALFDILLPQGIPTLFGSLTSRREIRIVCREAPNLIDFLQGSIDSSIEMFAS